MDTDANSKKASLEDLPKEDLIKKCKGLLNILQKAKQTKESLIEENNSLKEKLKASELDTEMLESLIQQKIQLVTCLEEIKSEKKVLENKLKDCEYNLASATDRIVALDNENEGCRRQIGRLVDENEQLLIRLDCLEKEAEELKQQQPEDSKTIQHYQMLKVEFEQLEKTHDHTIKSNKELVEKNEELLEERDRLNQNIKFLEESKEAASVSLSELKNTIQETTNENNQYQNTIFNIDKEQKNFCGQCSDLQDNNDKLKDKLKLFHSKLVKFAGDVKLLKDEKNKVLSCFKEYVQQVKVWENQLIDISLKAVNQFNRFESEKSQLTSDCDSLKIKLDSMEQENLILNGFNKELSDSVQNLKSKISNDQSEKLFSDNKLLTEKFTNIIKQIEECSTELESLRSDRNSLKEQCQNLTSASKLLKEKVETEMHTTKEEKRQLQEQNDSLLKQAAEHSTNNEILTKNVDNYQSIIRTLEDQLAELTDENKNISNKLGELQETLFLTENNSSSRQQTLTILRKENGELLAEMNEMNQVLKERGETISKLHEHCEELLKNVKSNESQNKRHIELLSEKDCVIKELEDNIGALKNSALSPVVPIDVGVKVSEAIGKENDEILLLRNEIIALKEKLMRLEEASQDVCYAESETLSTSTISRTEDLSRIRDLEGSWEERYGKLRLLALKLKGKIREVGEQLAKEQTEKNELQQKLANSHRTIQTLQSQCDLLHDDLDSNKVELVGYTKQLDIAASNKSTHLKSLADNEELITRLKSEIESLTKEKSSTDVWKKQVSGKVQNLKRELDANQLVKKDLEVQIKKLNVDLEEKCKLLNDEIEKHNATKNLLSESHNECKKQSVLNLEIQDYERSMKELTQKLDNKKETITKLKNQVDQQNNSIGSLKEQNRLLDERTQSEEKDLTTARNELQAYKKRVADFEGLVIEKDEKIVHLTRALEMSKAEKEEVSTHLSKVVADNQRLCDALKNDKQLLYSQNSSLEMKIRELNENQKLKEEELREICKEYDAYKVRAQSVLRSGQVRDVGLVEKLNEEVASLGERVRVLTSENIELQAVSEDLKGQNYKLLLEKDNVESEFNNFVTSCDEEKDLCQTLLGQHEKTIAEQTITIKSLKVHADTLSQCYRQQLSDQEARHNREIIELQSKSERVQPAVDNPLLVSPATPREQGEGSECIDLSTNNKLNHPLPLDKLLNSEVEQDSGFLRKQIAEHETKVNYLTSLLADTEQDLVKHVQMNKLLKEEIRRYQRSEEREKHAENLEYLKNIVYKFATLNSGDERFRLVPVLNTILKFSPDETNQLNLVAKGEVPGRGWSDYLPMWSGGKPQ